MSCANCIHSEKVPLEHVQEEISSKDPKKVAEFRANRVDCYFDNTLEMVCFTEAERCDEYTPNESLEAIRGIDEIRSKLFSLAKIRDSTKSRSYAHIRALAQIKALRWILGTELE